MTQPPTRYRITRTPAGGAEQTWVMLPDYESARMQAEELARREKETRVRLYREAPGVPREEVDLTPARLPPGSAGSP